MGSEDLKMPLKGWLFIWGVIFFLISIPLCLYRIAPGEVGVVIDMFGSKKGVEENEITVGFHWLAPWKTVYKFPIYEQNHQWQGEEGFNFQTREGLSVHSNIGITFHLEPTKIHELFSRYRRGMEEITHLFIRNNIRDAINRAAAKKTIEELYGPKKEEFFTDIQEDLRKELDFLGFKITHLYIMGEFGVPPTVKEALNKKIEAIQRAQQRENELREAEAEAKKEVAKVEGLSKASLIRADAEAKANKVVSQSLTRELIEWESVRKWDGKLPQTMSGKEIPFLMQVGK